MGQIASTDPQDQNAHVLHIPYRNLWLRNMGTNRGRQKKAPKMVDETPKNDIWSPMVS